jgi:hypothetical protein
VFTRAEVEPILVQLAGTHHLVIGSPCPATAYAHYLAPTTLMRGLSRSKIHSSDTPQSACHRDWTTLR